ncbi:leucine-rich repeat and IQ domain-containing protein 1 isoform X2 [Melanotaenia boesemani]|uniref:leucine-rich repeat and IQ domain-containing protein 1 isoform X2 n=1 Tax=Melanotaenia boesemani TaxID=1250792 RepID=UPI001C0587A7|nr:leucine-rich repeat and IQ domain-containing protein 1 isoform X2 [Melanotaenia boesemani]
MTDSNETCESVMLQPNDLIMSDIDESKEELGGFSYQEEVDSDIPASLLSYFETSKSRAAACEKIILEDFEDFTASHQDDRWIKLPTKLNKDTRKLNDQTTHETENEENMTGDKYVESEIDLVLEMSEYRAERDKCHCEDVQKEEQRRQREADFQEQLRRIMEAEKRYQMELELKEKRAQERLEQELLLQQEIISNLKKQVEHERRMIEEEQMRKKQEEEEIKEKEKKDEKKREEEDKRKRQEEKKRLEEEEKRKYVAAIFEKDKKKKDEEQKKKEEEREREVEKDRIEEVRKNEEEKRIQELQFKGEEMRRKRGEEDRNKEKGEKKLKREEEETEGEEERKFLVAGKKWTDEEKKKTGQELKLKDELKKMEEDGRKMRDEGEKRGEKEQRNSKQVEMRMKHETRDEEEEEEKSEGERAQAERKMTDRVLTKEGDESIKTEGEVQLRGGEEKKRYEERRKSVENINIIRKKEEKKTIEQSEWQQKEEEIRHMQEIQDEKSYVGENRKMEHERKGKDKKKSHDELKKPQQKDGMQKEENETKHGMRQNVEETKVDKERKIQPQERGVKESKNREGEQEKDRMLINNDKLREKKGENNILKSQNNNTNNSWTSWSPAETAHLSDKNICQASAVKPCSPSCSPAVCLPEHTEQKRLSWMKDCVPWSKLSLKNKRKQKSSAQSQRGQKRVAEASRLPLLCPHTLLQSSNCKSLQEITTVTLEDLPCCSLSTLVQCNQLRSLTLIRCGLKSLEGISQLQHLCYIDVQENDISFVDCENMSSLQVLRLANNKLKSIHGLNGADNLSVLDISYNSITRIAGLESVKRLQKLSVNHNQLISTRGLRDVYTLLHLDCSHNHLATTEGLENNALLHTLDLRSNALTEPPCLNNQVLLRELHLDDNNISSLQGLSACWLPLMQNFTAAQNRITQLPFMVDFVSLEKLDLRFNCLSELQNLCENLEGCCFLQEIHLTGNPLQQDGGWRSTLQKAVPRLLYIDSQQTDSFLSPCAAQKVSVVPDCFLMFCQAQLQQTQDLQQHHSSELRNASSPLDAVKSICHHLTMALKIAEDQRFAHEYGDTAMTAERLAAGQTVPEKTLDMDIVIVEKCVYHQDMKSTKKQLAVAPSRSFEESLCDTFDVVTSSPWTESVVRKIDSGSVHIFTSNGGSTLINPDKATASSFQESELESMAAAVIQHRWRKYKQKCGNVDSPSITERAGETNGIKEKPESGPAFINRSSADQDCAATVIQAFWRGFALRRRLGCALAAAAVTWPDTGEEDTFEEVDVEEFVFDEPALEKYWTVTLSEDSPPSHHPVSEQLLSPKPSVSSHGHSQSKFPAPLAQSPKQAWMAGQHMDSHRSQSPPSSSVLSGLSERTEKILEEWGFTDQRTALLMIKRAQKMKSTKQQKKHRNPSEHLTMFRNYSYQPGPVGARNKPAQCNRCSLKGAVGEAKFGLQQAERTEQMRREQAQQRLLTQHDRISESEHFLPEINSSTLNGGRVQLVGDPAYVDRPHATGLWANRLVGQPDKVNAHRNSSGQERKEALCPNRVMSAPSKKERISFRDNPVQMSGGWGGGKKRHRLHK